MLRKTINNSTLSTGKITSHAYTDFLIFVKKYFSEEELARTPVVYLTVTPEKVYLQSKNNYSGLNLLTKNILGSETIKLGEEFFLEIVDGVPLHLLIFGQNLYFVKNVLVYPERFGNSHLMTMEIQLYLFKKEKV